MFEARHFRGPGMCPSAAALAGSRVLPPQAPLSRLGSLTWPVETAAPIIHEILSVPRRHLVTEGFVIDFPTGGLVTTLTGILSALSSCVSIHASWRCANTTHNARKHSCHMMYLQNSSYRRGLHSSGLGRGDCLFSVVSIYIYILCVYIYIVFVCCLYPYATCYTYLFVIFCRFHFCA